MVLPVTSASAAQRAGSAYALSWFTRFRAPNPRGLGCCSTQRPTGFIGMSVYPAVWAVAILRRTRSGPERVIPNTPASHERRHPRRIAAPRRRCARGSAARCSARSPRRQPRTARRGGIREMPSPRSVRGCRQTRTDPNPVRAPRSAFRLVCRGCQHRGVVVRRQVRRQQSDPGQGDRGLLEQLEDHRVAARGPRCLDAVVGRSLGKVQHLRAVAEHRRAALAQIETAAVDFHEHAQERCRRATLVRRQPSGGVERRCDGRPSAPITVALVVMFLCSMRNLTTQDSAVH